MKKIIGLALFLGAVWVMPAAADPIFGAPSDDFTGCDSVNGGSCNVAFDENGHITASFSSFLFGNLPTTVASVTPTSNADWVDSTGAALEVHSYTLQVGSPSPGADSGFVPFFNGAVGLCEFGVAADGSACTGDTGNDKSDVVVFNYSTTDHKLHIDFLSDNENVFNFATDFNVLENGPEGKNGALYHALGNTGGGEDVFYNITSDSPGGVPEPASWALMISGFGLAGTALRRRRAQVATAA